MFSEQFCDSLLDFWYDWMVEDVKVNFNLEVLKCELLPV